MFALNKTSGLVVCSLENEDKNPLKKKKIAKFIANSKKSSNFAVAKNIAE